jgi:hypothetical protein
VVPISLSEVLNHDARLPRHVQLNIDYTSPDFVMDGNVTPAADMFSLGMLIIARYEGPGTKFMPSFKVSVFEMPHEGHFSLTLNDSIYSTSSS